MTLTPQIRAREPVVLGLLIVAQIVCAAFFLGDLMHDVRVTGTFLALDPHLYVEAVAAVVLLGSVIVEIRIVQRLLQRKARLEANLSMASAAVHDVIEAHFDNWGLTPAEKDVATFLVKGLSTAEIASVRGNAEGTVKAHLHGLYRKSGTRNRAEVLSLLIDSMMDGTLPGHSGGEIANSGP